MPSIVADGRGNAPGCTEIPQSEIFPANVRIGRLADGNLAAIDEVLSPNYVNTAMGGTDLAGIKAMIPALSSVVKGQHAEDEELVAEGDAVVARFNWVVTFHDGSTSTHRALA